MFSYQNYLNSQNSETFYTRLGVKEDATPEEIKKAYYQKARATHPDKTQENTHSRFDEIKEAYDTLANPETRKQYDAQLQRENRIKTSFPQPATTPQTPKAARHIPTKPKPANSANNFNPAVMPFDLYLIIFTHLSFKELFTITFVSSYFNELPFWQIMFRYFHPNIYKEFVPSSSSVPINYKREFYSAEKFSLLYKTLPANQILTLTFPQRNAVEQLLKYTEGTSCYNNQFSSTYSNIYNLHEFFFHGHRKQSRDNEKAANALKEVVIDKLYGKKELTFQKLSSHLSVIMVSPSLHDIYRNLCNVGLITRHRAENSYSSPTPFKY